MIHTKAKKLKKSMKLFVTITALLFLSGFSQSQLNEQAIVSHIERHELPSYLEVYSLEYKSIESDAVDGRISVSGLLKLKEPLYQVKRQKLSVSEHIGKTNLTKKLPIKSELGYNIYSRLLDDELSKKTVLDQKYEAGSEFSFTGDLVFNKNSDGYSFHTDPSSPLSYQSLSARVKGDFNDPVVDIDNFVDSTLLSLATNKIDCASESEKASIQRLLSLLRESAGIETNLMQRFVTESDVPDLLVDVAQVGLQEELSFKKIIPGKESYKLEKLKSREISIKAEGKLEGIMGFLETLGRLRIFLGIPAVTISQMSSQRYKLDMILDVQFSDLDAANTAIGLVPFSKCVELFKESRERTTWLLDQASKSIDNANLFRGLKELLTDSSKRIEIESISGSLQNPQKLSLTGKHHRARKSNYLIDAIEGFQLKHHSIQAISDHKKRIKSFSIVITLDEIGQNQSAKSTTTPTNFHKSFTDLKARAHSGNSEAQKKLGMLYLFGNHEGKWIDMDPVTGIEWLITSSHNGNSEASRIK